MGGHFSMKYSVLAITTVTITLLISGCYSLHDPYDGNGKWSKARSSIRSVVVMPPLVSSGRFDDDGELQLGSERAVAAQENAVMHLREVLGDKLPGATISTLPSDRADDPEIAAVCSAFERVNRHIIGNSYAPAPGNLSSKYLTLGSVLRDAEIDADVAVFLWAEDFGMDPSYEAREIGKEIARGVLASSGEDRIGSPYSSDEYPRGISAALVKVSTGDILWFNYDEYSWLMRLDRRSQSERFISELMRWL